MKIDTLIALFGCLALPFLCSGENLVTLDGKTYTNAVFLTNYPTVTMIQYDGGKAGIKSTNLPEKFKSRYGILQNKSSKLKIEPGAVMEKNSQVSPVGTVDKDEFAYEFAALREDAAGQQSFFDSMKNFEEGVVKIKEKEALITHGEAVEQLYELGTNYVKLKLELNASSRQRKLKIQKENLDDSENMLKILNQILGTPNKHVKDKADTSRENQKSGKGPTKANDSFLEQHRNSELESRKTISYKDTKEDHFAKLVAVGKGFQLIASVMQWNSEGTKEDSYYYADMSFAYGHEASVKDILQKFIEWDGIASRKKVEKFEKIIGEVPGINIFGYVGTNIFVFKWNGKKNESILSVEHRGPLREFPAVRDSYTRDIVFPTGEWFSKNDVIHFNELLNSLPALKEELAEKIRNQEAQKDLFK